LWFLLRCFFLVFLKVLNIFSNLRSFLFGC
jgi:hypothetical protein